MLYRVVVVESRGSVMCLSGVEDPANLRDSVMCVLCSGCLCIWSERFWVGGLVRGGERGFPCALHVAIGRCDFAGGVAPRVRTSAVPGGLLVEFSAPEKRGRGD